MTNKTEPIIQVESITAAYDDTVILKDVSLYVNRGEVLAILGGSGCGKSTLMKQMIGLEKPVAGRVLIDGRDIVTAEGDERLEILRQIGVMYQSGALFGSMTLEENVCLPLEEFTDLPPEAIDLIARMKLSLVGLAGFEKHMPSELSGGMRKRAAIARALALDPQVLFMDELSAGLDPVTSADLDQLVRNLSDNLNMTFIIVTHELPSIFAIADRAVILDKSAKGIIAEGRPIDLKEHNQNPYVRRFFNREPTSTDNIEAVAT
jgi:phospholipid/cholesterol/gamma-HCH transport system ATP-binding protein